MSASAIKWDEHRTVLTGHCYRMLGSVVDAEDAVQETMVRAWRGFDGFDARASLRTWLYRIATNVCLDQLADRRRRARPMEEGPVGRADDDLRERPRAHWLEPVPDVQVLPADGDPAEALALRHSIRLAFVAALQHLPPKPRAVLLLTDVLGWSAAEIAASLDTSVAAVTSALQRARATLAERKVPAPAALTSAQAQLVDRYVAAFTRYDVNELTRLMHEDATLSMPPFQLWLQGHASISAWLTGRGSGCRGSVLVPTAASGSPAFAQYRDGGKTPFALIVLEVDGERIRAINSFLDIKTLFPRFGLPLQGLA